MLLDKNVIVKVLNEKCKESASFQRFQREIAALSSLGHANIVTAYATGIHQEHPYLVTEEMDAHTLADLLAMPTESIDRPILDIESKRSIICQICDALSYLHSHGLVHRDLRPENILISDDKQYVNSRISSLQNSPQIETKCGSHKQAR